MCGYACIRCGQCGKRFDDTPQIGTCPLCGATNEPGAAHCEACGAPLPPLPGRVGVRTELEPMLNSFHYDGEESTRENLVIE